MATYTSKPTIIARPAQQLSEQFADFTRLQEALDRLPAEQREKVGDVSFGPDTITINTPQVGAITLRATERSARGLTLTAEGSPVPMTMGVAFRPVDADSTEVTGQLNVDLPMMLRPLVGPTLQKAADQFGELFAKLA